MTRIKYLFFGPAAILVIQSIAAAPLEFDITNVTGYHLTEIFIKPVSARKWEQEILAGKVLKSSEKIHISFATFFGDCFWNIRAIDADGDSYFQNRVNLCGNADISIKPLDLD